MQTVHYFGFDGRQVADYPPVHHTILVQAHHQRIRIP